MIEINSTPKSKKINDTQQNTNIKYKMECIGFLDTIINRLKKTANRQKPKNKKFIIKKKD